MLTTRCLIPIVLIAAAAAPATGADRPNVLLICVDDLRPELGCYGAAQMKTPNLDRLASSGRLFRRHYAAVPTCGASRFALMTGRYPRTGASYNNGAFGQLRPGDRVTTMPEAFGAAGYTTVSIGKVSHQPDGRVYSYQGVGDGRPEMPDAWDQVTGPTGKWGTGWDAFFGYADGTSRTDRRGEKAAAPAFESADVDDTGYPDGLTAQMAASKLGELRAAGKPWLMAVGFFKPHLPFNAPKKYWNLYDDAAIGLAPWREAPKGLGSKIPLHGGGEFMGYTHPVNPNKDDAYARRVRHAYYAAVSYADAQVGKVLDELDRLGLADKTIVIVWGDHGWHLGDQGMWGKHTVFERALHSALIVRTPGMKRAGEATDALAGSIDLYPTLMELCGIDRPAGLDGRPLTPALDDPAAKVNEAVRGFWRMNGHTADSYRFDDYRVTLWRKGGGGAGEPDLVEVYDHRDDPDETRNVAVDHPEPVERVRRIGGAATP